MRLRSTAPAKLILCGEHAVVYGQPALSLALDLPTQCLVDFEYAHQPCFTLKLSDYSLEKQLDFNQAWLETQQIEQRFSQFLNNQIPINAVCQTPFDLILLCLSHFNQFHPLQSGHWQIQIQSQAWRGRGLGSSAAVILSLLRGLFYAHKINDDINDSKTLSDSKTINDNNALLRLSQALECYQHGQSSGIDPATLLSKGLIRYQRHQPIVALDSSPQSFWLIDTGEPASSTGESVQQVKTDYAQDPTLWHKFADCTEKMQTAWLNHNNHAIAQTLSANQQLLEQIGVVPKPVQDFIARLKSQTAMVAKVCGAGSVRGDKAGVVLAYHPVSNSPTNLATTPNAEDQLKQLCKLAGYHLQQVNTSTKGVQCELLDA
jgi:mevalonate kinase